MFNCLSRKLFFLISAFFLFALFFACFTTGAAENSNPFIVKWLGHSCLYIQAPDGTKIVTDPYDQNLPYPAPAIEANLVTVSHEHGDHNAADRVKGSPKIINTTTTFNSQTNMVSITGFPSFHDDAAGAKLGSNIIFLFKIGKYKIVHLGDLGEIPAPEVIKALKGADLLFAPVGEVYTMPVEKVNEITKLINAKTVVPIHYSLTKEKPIFNLNTIDKYLNTLKSDTKVRHADEIVIEGKLKKEVIVLSPWKP